MKVLAVDDDYSIVLSLKKMLSPEFDVIAVMDPMDALDRLERESFAAFITDWHMPGFSGLELLTVVQQRWPNVRRILLTAAPNEPEVRAAIREGLVQVLIEKPYNRAVLKAAMKGLN